MKIIKNTTIIAVLILFSFGWSQNRNPSERFFSQLPQEIQDQLSPHRISWGQTEPRPITPSDRDAEDLYGEWEHEDDNATLWVTSGTDQTIPNSSQTQGQEPADGAINIDGPISGSMNYMMNMGGMYGYDMVYLALSNNVITDNDDWENMTFPLFRFIYVSYPEYSYAGGEFIIGDTVDGDFVEYFYEIENADDQITVDATTFRINITDLTLSNDNGDSTYVLSGNLVPGTIDIEAGVSTSVSSPMFENDFGPVSGDESMTWQLHENGTGLEIISGEDYYDSWSDTTELQWSANDDSMTVVFLYWDDYYYEEDSDTMNFAYNVENDTLGINVTMDLCEMMDDDYYYGECFEMMSMFLGIEDIQEVLIDFDMTMSFSRPLNPEIIVEPDTLNFGVVYTGYPNTMDLTIHNGGLAVLTIEFIELYGDDFYLASDLSLPVAVTTSLSIPVGFDGGGLGDHAGTMNITSNDTSNTIIVIPMFAEVSDPPIISVSPDSLYSALLTGEQGTQILELINNGGSELQWEVSISNSRNVTRSSRNNIFSQTSTRATLPIRHNSLRDQTETFDTRTTPSGFSFLPVIPSTLERDVSIALIKDVDPWGNALNEQVLQELDMEYDLVNRGTLMDLNLSNYDLIVVASDQPQELYDVFDSRLSDFETFVTSGGTIQFNGADQGWNDGFWNELPSGVTHVNSHSNYNYVIDPSHPITEGITSEIYANTASHCFLQNYPDNTHFIMSDESGQYTLIEYALGGGLVIVTGITLDSQNNDIIFFQMLTNMINYAVGQSVPNWLSVSPDLGVTAMESMDNLEVIFNATGLFGGDYFADINIFSNDPVHPELTVPVHLNVTGVPDIELSQDSIDFGVTYTNFGGTDQISIGNNGTDVLEVTSITVDNDVFSLSLSSASIGDGEELELNVVFLPTVVGEYSGTITILSNDSNESEITIILVGNSIAPPVINVSPDSLYSALSTGETETQIMTILNNGMSDLEYDINIDGSPDEDPYVLGFDGSNDYVSFDNQTIQSMIGGNWANEKTISAWIKPVGSSPNISGGWGGDAIYGQASGSGNFFGISRGIIGGEDRIWVYNWDGNDDRIGIEYENSEWVHIALVQDNGMLYGYKNGELIGQVNTGASGAAGYQRIGGGTDNGGYFQGFLDEIRIWSVARTQDEIQNNTSHELSGDEDNIVGYWKFNEGAGTLVNDETANGNHGSVFGATWILSDATVYTSWIEASPASGIIIPGASSDINLEFNAQGFDAGTYTTSLLINSNDPVSPVINIPATLEIEFLDNDNAGLIPSEFALYQNYPNPFNPATTIRFDIPAETQHAVSLQVYDISGRMVETLVNEKIGPGTFKINWNASNHSSGVYFLKMETGQYIKTQKMILLK